MNNGVLGRCEEIRSCLNNGGSVKRDNTVFLCNPQKGPQIIACCRKPHLVAQESKILDIIYVDL